VGLNVEECRVGDGYFLMIWQMFTGGHTALFWNAKEHRAKSGKRCGVLRDVQS
jgi:hypothetical protein